MRFLTHNSLRSRAKGAAGEQPLEIIVSDFEIDESESDIDFIKHILPTLDWNGVVLAAKSINFTVPEVYDSSLAEDEDFLKLLYNLLIDVHVVTGTLKCTETGKIFPIENRIPNLMYAYCDVLLNSVACIQ